MLRRFYAVTLSGSLYSVSMTDKGIPVAEVKKVTGPEDQVPVGSVLLNGSHAAITSRGVIAFTPWRYRDPEMVNTRNWGGATSCVVALFTNRKMARKCLRANRIEPWDNRWKNSTEAVLSLIGQDHPAFIIAGSVLRGENWKRYATQT